ncbi:MULTISPECIES: nitroreductase family deazaflavin-dependent oxidoreductase [Pseudonocardia]|uniref:Deazaflavin-dependent nitroreductase n=2 Tax=Pseudonocardia TaxID=1847 RepID=A0A1Y2MY14_PSEAH|nr:MULTISPECIES: nitroreductase family deazaflavin-dependent oxidoreductase [Pseudonocardia]OSY39697.1 Deazaflavin-dependent nitroreductase [Pseudonocardia autotrophica]TDN72827.1 deazaflavin-dependent oxidoreductase (nitroreductase family) [Pseudonocardia autotrophica]BBG03545.1 nitroreductase [Pseudonocardia autotrophica]GEC28566.1 nitroreductase [Pseudonocardia saturnea]
MNPPDFALKAMNAGHRLLIKLTGGKIGHSAMGMPVVELTTTGRKSGEPRTVLLTAPVHGDGRYVVVASRGGDDKHPAWFLNLRANPEVQVAVQGGDRVPMRARIASTDERAELWPRIAGEYRNYAGYQRSTEREIPLVHLEPKT